MKNAATRLTVIIPARNEVDRWPVVLSNLASQTLQPDEIVIADGMSTDGSRALLDEALGHDARVVLVDNPARIVPAALNAALAVATGDVIARMDTHADYAPDYLETVVGFLAEHPEVPAVGGAMETAGEGDWGRAIAAVLSRPIGLGGARHRVGGAPGPIVHVFSGCYRREALLAVGGWDERFRANEDYETDVRVAATARSSVWLEPRAKTTWYVRRTVMEVAVQMWRYGFHKGLTLHLHPRSLKPRQLAPPLLVLALVAGVAVEPFFGVSLIGSYVGACALLGARAARSDGASWWRGAAIPPVVHLSWGLALLAGLVRWAPQGFRRVSQAPSVIDLTLTKVATREGSPDVPQTSGVPAPRHEIPSAAEVTRGS